MEKAFSLEERLHSRSPGATRQGYGKARLPEKARWRGFGRGHGHGGNELHGSRVTLPWEEQIKAEPMQLQQPFQDELGAATVGWSGP